MFRLSVSLPDGNSMKLIPKFKEALPNRTVPIIVISSDSDLLTKVAAFGMGADDYVCKPPEASELKARIIARLRAVDTAKKDSQSLLQYGGIAIDMERMSVEVTHADGAHKLLELTPFEFKILKLLVGRPGQVFSRDTIIERVWGIGRFVSARTVDAHISHLRRKLMGAKICVETVLTAGYKVSLIDKPSDSDRL